MGGGGASESKASEPIEHDHPNEPSACVVVPEHAMLAGPVGAWIRFCRKFSRSCGLVLDAAAKRLQEASPRSSGVIFALEQSHVSSVLPVLMMANVSLFAE